MASLEPGGNNASHPPSPPRAGNGAYSNASQAQWVPMLNSNPSSSLRFCSGKDTGFVTVTHSGAAANSTSRLTVTFIDSSGDQIYTYSKSNPRDLPVIPLDKQTTGVETVLSIGDGDGAPVSPAVMGAARSPSPLGPPPRAQRVPTCVFDSSQ